MSQVVDWCSQDFRYYEFDVCRSYGDNVSPYYLESYIHMGTLGIL